MKKIYKIDDGVIPVEDFTRKRIEEAGYALIETACHSSQEIIAICSDASALIVFGEHITRDVIHALP